MFCWYIWHWSLLLSFQFCPLLNNFLFINSGTTQLASPMVFLGCKFWTETLPVFPLLRALSKGKQYDELLFICDTWQEALAFLISHPPVQYDPAYTPPTAATPAVATPTVTAQQPAAPAAVKNVSATVEASPIAHPVAVRIQV